MEWFLIGFLLGAPHQEHYTTYLACDERRRDLEKTGFVGVCDWVSQTGAFHAADKPAATRNVSESYPAPYGEPVQCGVFWFRKSDDLAQPAYADPSECGIPYESAGGLYPVIRPVPRDFDFPAYRAMPPEFVK